jgi:hypothetical protein
MTDAVLLTYRLAEHEAAEHREVMAFARPDADADWQDGEYKMFFLDGIYGMLTDAKSASLAQIRSLAVTAQAAAWIRNRCANPYWFWSLIGAACVRADALPLTLTNVKEGARLLYNMQAEPMGRRIGISGHPNGYSGDYTPWHTRDCFSRGTLWNNDSDRETGLKYGFLMLQRTPVKRTAVWRARRGSTPDGMSLIFNPLFDELASVPPAVEKK